MATPKFILQERTLGTSKVISAIVKHDRVLSEEEALNIAYNTTGYPIAKIRAVFEGLNKAIKSTIADANKAKIDGFASFFEVCKGGFATSQGPWVKGVNYLEVNATAENDFQFSLRAITPVNDTKSPVNPILNSVYCPDKGEFDLIGNGYLAVINGADLAPDTAAADEGVWFVPDSGSEVKFTITLSEDAQVQANAPSTGLTAGAVGRLEVRTRSGLGASYGLKIASRRVTVVG